MKDMTMGGLIRNGNNHATTTRCDDFRVEHPRSNEESNQYNAVPTLATND